jgi:amino acid adenylation domain-containing protein
MSKLVQEFLEHSATRHANKVGLVCDDRRFTYGQIDALCDRLAAALAARGVTRGDRVAIYLENSAETVFSVFGTLKADAVFLVLNPTTKVDKLVYILNDCRAVTLITHARRLEALEPAWARLPHLRTVLALGLENPFRRDTKQFLPLDEVLEGADTPVAPAKRNIDVDLAALMYTSGSTGGPKGVMLTHRNIVSAAASITTYLENTPDDVILDVLPLSFDYGLYQVLMAFKIGARVVLERSFTYSHVALEKIARERVTGFPIVPTISAMLLQLDLTRYDFSSVRYFTNTGAPLPVEHIEKLRRLFPQVKIFSMYGLTECKRVSYLPPEQIERRPRSVGKAMPNVEAYVVDEKGERVPPGTVGELVVRGSNVMVGYWELPEETARALRAGPVPGELVLHTGDLFQTDEDGYLYFVGRRDDMIKTRGQRVSPREVEEVLHRLQGVAEAAVLGVPDPVLGTAIKAVVRQAPGARLTAQEVMAHCLQHLEDFMVPKLVEFRDTMPTTDTGKVSKRELSQA